MNKASVGKKIKDTNSREILIILLLLVENTGLILKMVFIIKND
jgi:hypothetical protein